MDIPDDGFIFSLDDESEVFSEKTSNHLEEQSTSLNAQIRAPAWPNLKRPRGATPQRAEKYGTAVDAYYASDDEDLECQYDEPEHYIHCESIPVERERHHYEDGDSQPFSSPPSVPTMLDDEEVLRLLPQLRGTGKNGSPLFFPLRPRVTHLRANAVIQWSSKDPRILPLRELSDVIRYSEYSNPSWSTRASVPYLTIRLLHGCGELDHRPVIRLWEKGAMSIAGVRTEDEARNAAETALFLVKGALLKLSKLPAVSTSASVMPEEFSEHGTTSFISTENLTLHKFRICSTFAAFDLRSAVRLDCLANTKVSPEKLKGVGFCTIQHYPGSQCCVIWLEGISNHRDMHDDVWYIRCRVHVSGRILFSGARTETELLYAFYTLIPLVCNHLHRKEEV